MAYINHGTHHAQSLSPRDTSAPSSESTRIYAATLASLWRRVPVSAEPHLQNCQGTRKKTTAPGSGPFISAHAVAVTSEPTNWWKWGRQTSPSLTRFSSLPPQATTPTHRKFLSPVHFYQIIPCLGICPRIRHYRKKIIPKFIHSFLSFWKVRVILRFIIYGEIRGAYINYKIAV